MLTGLSYMAVVCKIMVNQSEGVFGHEKNVYIAKTVSREEALHRSNSAVPHRYTLCTFCFLAFYRNTAINALDGKEGYNDV